MVLLSSSININLIFFDIRYSVVIKLIIFIFKMSDLLILTRLSWFCCPLKIIIFSSRTLYPSTQGFPGLKQLICSSYSPSSLIVKAQILKEEPTICFGRDVHAVNIHSRPNLRDTDFVLPLSANS